jgi:glycerol-3-phosphate dehydrogenase
MSAQIYIESRYTTCIRECDILVVGGGSAGTLPR